MSPGQSARVVLAALLAMLWTGGLAAQTAAGPSSAYTPKDDVEIGRTAAAAVERHLPVLHDEEVTRYLALVVRRLAAAIPSELQHTEFHYTVQVVDVRGVNARALPGGPIYLNRGLIESARTAGEVAGVIAHELGHIALRHGTAYATSATEFTVAALTRALLAALDEDYADTSRPEHRTADDAEALLRFGPEFERQADALGLLVMARAGYDPHEMDVVLQTLGRADRERSIDRGELQRRHEAIVREAASLSVEQPVDDRGAFERVRARLRRIGRAPTPQLPRPGRVKPALTRFTTYTDGHLFRVRVPSTWRVVADGNAVVFAPHDAYRDTGGQTIFTHGVEIGMAPRDTDDLTRATDVLIGLLASDNPNLRRLSNFDRSSLGNHPAVRAVLSSVSEVTGREERMEVVTALLRDSRLLYALVVAPRRAFADYEPTFRQVIASVVIIE